MVSKSGNDVKIHTYAQAEAATEAARLCYEKIIRDAARAVGSERELSRRLGQKSPNAVGIVLTKGKFSALRRMATAVQELAT